MINSAMAVTETPILSRLDRLDNVLRQLEEIRSCNRSSKSSPPSTPSSGTLTSDGHISSVDFSPKSLEKHCRPIDRVVMETEVKGTLIERLDHVEDRVVKGFLREYGLNADCIESQLCLQMEEGLEAEKQKEEKLETEKQKEEKVGKRAKKKGLKQLVKRVIKGKGEHKSRIN